MTAIDICVTIKNRSRVRVEETGKTLDLFPNCIKSMEQSLIAANLIKNATLYISNFGSDDHPLEEWIFNTAPSLKIYIIDKTDDKIFNRGKGLNIAAAHGSGDILCFMDTDMLLSKEFWQEGLLAIKNNAAYFPICYSYNDSSHKDGWWRDSGFGMSMVKREWYNAVNKVDELQHYGLEDNYFVSKLSRLVRIYRPKVPNYYHQWHPNDRAWKERYIK